jgi:N4-gp56 family major capsid protein
MTNAYETGAIYSTTLPAWQRTYYEGVLLETLRTKSILMPYCRVKEDFNALHTGQIVFSEVYDLEPNWNETSESTIWKKGMSLDSRTVTIDLNWYHDIIKYSDHMNVLSYLQNGDTAGIVRDKLGVSMVDTLDILSRNAHLQHPNKLYGGDATSRATLEAEDIFDPDIAEDIRISLEEDEIPGISTVEDGGATIVCATSPRVIHDIRTDADSDWIDVQNYQSTGRKFRSEVGMWAGVRFVKTNRLRLRNHGSVTNQTQLSAGTDPGQGAATTVDTVYSPGQSGATTYVSVDDSSDFSVGDYVTIHTQSLGDTVLETDGFQETRRVVAKDSGGADRLSFDKPLLKSHSENDYVTTGLDVHASIFWGGPGVVYGVAERPNVIVPPKYDDALLINRIGWRGMLKFQLFRPEWFRVVETAGSV